MEELRDLKNDARIDSDKSRKYTLTEVKGASETVSQHCAGELITLSILAITDCSFRAAVDGNELRLEADGNGFMTASFLMPPHDVRAEISVVNNMARRPDMNMDMSMNMNMGMGMGGFGGMNMGMGGLGGNTHNT